MQDEMLPEATRAVIRHVYNQFYHDFSNIDLLGTTFVWQRTFADALDNFRQAVISHAMHFRVLYNTRQHSTLNGTAPEEARTHFTTLVDIGAQGDFALTPDFLNAVIEARAAADNRA